MGQLGRWRAVTGLVSLVVASCIASGGSSDEFGQKAFNPTLDWGICPAEVEVEFVQSHRCGFLTVPQDRAKPDGLTVRMFVVKVDPEQGEASSDPILVFGKDLGMPGGFAGLAPLASRTHRIVYLIEVRGVGHSEPSLDCPEVAGLTVVGAERTTGSASLTEEFLATVQACRQRLASDGVDVADFDIRAVAQDSEGLRVALGVERWNLASYGTTSRYLLEYLRSYQQRVRAAFMDSPQFPQVDEVSGAVSGTHSALERLFEACGADVSCAKTYPDLAASWSEALARLEQAPLHGRVRSNDTHRIDVTMDAALFLRVTRFVLGGVHPADVGLLPQMVTSAAEGRMEHWVGAIAAADPPFCAGYHPVCSSREPFSLGAYLTVLCRDQGPFVDRSSLATETAGESAFAHVFLHHPFLAACEVWDVPAADAVVHEPVKTEVPLLIIAGRFDSFSPPPVARAAAESFDNAWVMEVPDTHNTLGHSECVLAIRNAWLDEPNSAPTGTGCLKHMRIAFSTQGGVKT